MKAFSIFFVVIFGAALYGQGKAGAFLRRPVGSEMVAFGGANAANVKDVNAIYANPAGLPEMIKYDLINQAQFYFSPQTLGRREVAAAYARVFPTLFTVAVGAYQYAIDDIDGRDQYGFPTETFSDQQSYFSLSIARDFHYFSAGVTAKYFTHSLGDYTGTGVAFDAGARYAPLRWVTLGVAARNIGATVGWDTPTSREEEAPMSLRFGVKIEQPWAPLTIVADGVQTTDQDLAYAIGAEYRIIESFGFRAGFHNERFSFGGFAHHFMYGYLLQLQYAAAEDIVSAGLSHHVTLGVGF